MAQTQINAMQRNATAAGAPDSTGGVYSARPDRVAGLILRGPLRGGEEMEREGRRGARVEEGKGR